MEYRNWVATFLWRISEVYHQDIGTVISAEAVPNARRFDPSWGASANSFRTIPPDAPPLDGLSPAVSGPVLTGRDVDDYDPVSYVADPFLWPGADGRWHMFFEVYGFNTTPHGSIGHATSVDGLNWEYDQIVLDEDTHLSFPYVFAHDGEIYMIPEENPASDHQRVTLYRAEAFPTEWVEHTQLRSLDHRASDTVLFPWSEKWWLLVGDSLSNGLYLYHADTLDGDWTAHADNPVVSHRPSAGRPGGRPLLYDDRIVMFFQDCERRYGHRLRQYEITTLDTETYVDRETATSPILTPASGHAGWNTGNMHHIDPWLVDGRWLCAVDGNVSPSVGNQWSISIYVC